MTVALVDASELASGLKAGAPLLDVRTVPEYEGAHVEGARLAPLQQLDRHLEGLSPDRTVYVMCARGPRSEKAAAALEAKGFKDVRVLKGGIEGWTGAGFPVRREPTTRWPIERQVRLGAGTLVLAGAGLGWLLHPGFFALSAFVGAGLVFSAATNTCGMAMVLLCMPWNNRR